MARGALRGLIVPTGIVFMMLLAACASESQAPPPDVSPSAGPDRSECPSVELRGPDGVAPVLAGTWIGIGERGALPWPGTYEFNLLNSCVAWVGRSTEDGEEVGASWMNVFLGKMNPDFTISGDWAVASAGGDYCSSGAVGAECYQARGTLVLRIEWLETVDGDRVRLVLQEYTKLPNRSTGVGGFITGIWVRPGDEALFEVPVD